jgi:3-hydroxyisobutyrate dehydrogenase-like beta-hydroxyacid dehydrogenase
VARLAFIGLGTMGLPMARHLLEAGHDVVGLDLDPDQMAALGGRTADSVAAAVSEAEAVFTSLPDPDAVSRVAREIAQSSPEGALFIDKAKTGTADQRRIAAILELLGWHRLPKDWQGKRYWSP